MAKSGFALVLIFAVVIFASHTLAKPQSEHDQLEKIRTERSNTPGGGGETLHNYIACLITERRNRHYATFCRVQWQKVVPIIIIFLSYLE